MNLTITLDETISILDKYKLTPNELMFLQLLLILQNEDNEELFSKYIQILKTGGVDLRELIISLRDKEIVLKSYRIPLKGEIFDPYAISINKNFIKNLYKCSFELGKELFESYPQFGIVQNNQVPLRGISKFFNSLEDAYFRYGRCISWNLEKHKKIIDLIKWGKENSLICQSLGSFIVNNAWLDLEAMRNGDAGNYNFSAIREL